MSATTDKFNAAAGVTGNTAPAGRGDDHDGGGDGGAPPAASVRRRIQKHFAGRKIRGGGA